MLHDAVSGRVDFADSTGAISLWDLFRMFILGACLLNIPPSYYYTVFAKLVGIAEYLVIRLFAGTTSKPEFVGKLESVL
jgi:hypothetical protein